MVGSGDFESFVDVMGEFGNVFYYNVLFGVSM